MVLKWPNPILLACLWATLTPTLVCAQADRTGPAQNKPRKQGEGFIEYTLKRINPSDKDYGQVIDEGRVMVLAETIENGYFWSNIVTLALLLVSFFLIVFQQALLKRRALIFAEALCQYQSALARAEAHADEATRRNHELMDALRSASEAGARRQELSVTREAPTVAFPAPAWTAIGREKSGKGRGAPPSSAVSSATTATIQGDTPGAIEERKTAASAPTQAAPIQPGLDFIAQNNALQQQLGLTQDQVKQLRRQLNESERLLQAEKLKNRTIKGE